MTNMKKIIFLFAAVAVLASCGLEKDLQPQNPEPPQSETSEPSQEESSQDEPVTNEVAELREMSIMANATESKTLLQGDDVVWEKNDQIALIFSKNSAKYVQAFATTDAGASATFTGTLPVEVSVAGGYAATGYAVYPSSAVSSEGNVSFTLPTAVTANENGTFESGLNLSSAVISLSDLDATGETSTAFKNAFSVIRFTLPENVKSMKLSADANLVGSANMAFDTDRLKVASWKTPSKELTVTPAGATFTAGKAYNVLVYPGTYKAITVEMTDTDNCKYIRTVTGSFVFNPSEYYTFAFNTKFEKSYTFTATGRTIAAGDKVQTVFGSLHEETLTAAAGGVFTGNLPASVVHASTAGYAIYPASAYSAGHITYNLDPAAPADLYSAALTPTSTSVAFNSVKGALATLKVNVPAGVKSVKLVSDKGVVGGAEMTVSNGKLTAGAADGKEINLAAGSHTLTIYPVSGANVTATLTDAAGATITKTFTLSVAAGQSHTADLSGGLNFDKNGSFTHDSFTNGGKYEF